MIDAREQSLQEFQKKLGNNFNHEGILQKDQKKSVKQYLDASQDLFRFFRSLTLHTKDLNERQTQNQLWEDTLRNLVDKNSISRLYNKTRNFLTKKEYSNNKFKINFENSTLADGWDENKETENTVVLLRKDGNYFLAIMDKSSKTVFKDVRFLKNPKDFEKKWKGVKWKSHDRKK